MHDFGDGDISLWGLAGKLVKHAIKAKANNMVHNVGAFFKGGRNNQP